MTTGLLFYHVTKPSTTLTDGTLIRINNSDNYNVVQVVIICFVLHETTGKIVISLLQCSLFYGIWAGLLVPLAIIRYSMLEFTLYIKTMLVVSRQYEYRFGSP